MNDKVREIELLLKQLRWLLDDAEPLSKETILCMLIDYVNGYLHRTCQPELPNSYPTSDT